MVKRYSHHPEVIFLALLLPLILLAGCSRLPLVSVCHDSVPFLDDDLDRASLKNAVRESLHYVQDQPSDKRIQIADQSIANERLASSLEYFLQILETNPGPEELDRLLKEHFDIYQATGKRGFNPGRKMLVTGYFQPELPGSLTRKAPFLYPLYSVPDDLVRTGSGFGRRDNDGIVPYWTREEIETGNRLAGYELVWLKDPFDAFVLHVQGSGLIRLEDGTLRGVRYAAKNGHPYRSIGKYLVETGRMPLEKASLKTIREYIAAHPEERAAILHHNPSFIFFEWSQTHGAIGSIGRELTAGRSVAVDQSCFPAGALAFLQTRRPTRAENDNVTWSSLQRFVLVQDTGSAIRGPGRLDLFWGAGSEAGFEAGHMKEDGTLYFLLLKEGVQMGRTAGSQFPVPQ